MRRAGPRPRADTLAPAGPPAGSADRRWHFEALRPTPRHVGAVAIALPPGRELAVRLRWATLQPAGAPQPAGARQPAGAPQGG